MAILSSKLRSVQATDHGKAYGKGIMHFCPGCKEGHIIWTERAEGPKWTWNGSVEKPTTSPSVLLFTTHDDDGNPLPAGQRRSLCHYFLVDGKINFCGDCEHDLAGKQGVELPDFPDGYGGGED